MSILQVWFHIDIQDIVNTTLEPKFYHNIQVIENTLVYNARLYVYFTRLSQNFTIINKWFIIHLYIMQAFMSYGFIINKWLIIRLYIMQDYMSILQVWAKVSQYYAWNWKYTCILCKALCLFYRFELKFHNNIQVINNTLVYYARLYVYFTGLS